MTGVRSDGSWTPGLGLPIALPVGSDAPGPSPQVTAEFFQSTGTNDGAVSPPSRISPRAKSRPVSPRSLAQLDRTMPLRDRRVLGRISDHRFLTTSQVTGFEFTSHASVESAQRIARTVLARLQRSGLIRSLERRVGGVRAGSSANVWQLTPAGARLERDDGERFRAFQPTDRFLRHCLAEADAHLATLTLQQQSDVQRVTVETEPACWRRFLGPAGEQQLLQPDLAVVVEQQQFDDRWFIEVDLGSESLPTLVRKCLRYESYRNSGAEQSRHGGFPMVLWLFADERRASRLQVALERNAGLTTELYRIATPTTFLAVLERGAQ